MRNPKKGGSAKKLPAKAKSGGSTSKSSSSKSKNAQRMEMDVPAASGRVSVWRPGVDPLEEGEELDYDPTAYDCLHRFQLDWPSLSFDLIRDELGGPRATFPHCITLVAGTQATTAKQNYLAFLKLANLGQGRHGKKPQKNEDESESEDEDEMDESDDDEGSDIEDVDLVHGPPRMHYRMVEHVGGVNRIRACPQQPGVIAVWSDTAQVRIYDGSHLINEMANEAEQPPNKKNKIKLDPLAQHGHAMEGFALDWSLIKAGRLASGDCRKNIFVWEPSEGGKWELGKPYAGHESSVEDLAWSPTEDNVFASCSSDKTLRFWDTRDRGKPQLTVQAHDCDVNVISWNRSVGYMLASGADDGTLRIWDLRGFLKGEFSPVSEFHFHKGYVTGLEWCPYEGSMLASTASDNQLAVWDLALERDPEEEAALAPAGNAAAPEDLPAQLLFLHAGQQDLKECHWHAQIPGLIVSTAADCFNVFKASNM